MKKSFFLILYSIWIAFTIFLLFSVKIAPTIHWSFAFFPLMIIPALLVNALLLIFFIFQRKFALVGLQLLILLLGSKFILRTFAFEVFKQKEGNIKLLTYNVKVFNSYEDISKGSLNASKIIRFALEHDADIKCFQEFYHNPGLEKFNLISKFKKSTPYSYFDPSTVVKGQYFGLVIFSKYKMVKKGEIKFPGSTFNQAIYADMVTDKDTIRVYNVHLQSMSINENRLPTSGSRKENISRFRELFRKLREGSKDRTYQLEALLQNMQTCPYKIIVAGDLNDTPYSYTYEKLNEKLVNAFVFRGSGWGFTYNGKLDFLRIDNVFADKELNIKTFKTLNKIHYSDHFPLEVTFK